MLDCINCKNISGCTRSSEWCKNFDEIDGIIFLILGMLFLGMEIPKKNINFQKKVFSKKNINFQKIIN